MNLRNFFAELKRRNVYKVAVAYAGMTGAAEISNGPQGRGYSLPELRYYLPAGSAATSGGLVSGGGNLSGTLTT